MDFCINDKPLTNGQAKAVLEKVFSDQFDDISDRNGFPAALLYGDDRKLQKLRPMEGCVRTRSKVDDRLDIVAAYVAMPDCFFDESLSDEPVNAYEFVGTLIAILHERRHVDQLFLHREPENSLAKITAVNEFAMQICPRYATSNYWLMPVEIDAHYTAIREAYNCLSVTDGIGPDSADEYIRYYQMRRQKSNGKDFIPRPSGGEYLSAKMIFEAFADSYKSAVHEHRKYNSITMFLSKDYGIRMIGANRTKKQMFLDEQDGYRQEQMLASKYFDWVTMRQKNSEELKKILLGRLMNDMELDLSESSVFAESPCAETGTKYGDMAGRAFEEVMSQVRDVGSLPQDGLGKQGQDGPDV